MQPNVDGHVGSKNAFGTRLVMSRILPVLAIVVLFIAIPTSTGKQPASRRHYGNDSDFSDRPYSRLVKGWHTGSSRRQNKTVDDEVVDDKPKSLCFCQCEDRNELPQCYVCVGKIKNVFKGRCGCYCQDFEEMINCFACTGYD